MTTSRSTDRPALGPKDRALLAALARGEPEGALAGRNNEAALWQASKRLRRRMGARDNAHAVGLAYRMGILGPGDESEPGLVETCAILYALERPGIAQQVIRDMEHRRWVRPGLVEIIAERVSVALARMPFERAEMWRRFLREWCDPQMAPVALETDEARRGGRRRRGE